MRLALVALILVACVADNPNYGAPAGAAALRSDGFTFSDPDMAVIPDLYLPCTPKIGPDGEPCGCCRMKCCPAEAPKLGSCAGEDRGLVCLHGVADNSAYCADDPGVQPWYCHPLPAPF